MTRPPVRVIGAGSWGTAIAIAAHRAGSDVTLLARRNEHATALRETRRNQQYMPGIAAEIATEIRCLSVAEVEPPPPDACIFLCVPVSACRASLQELARTTPSSCPIVLTQKGFEQESGVLPIEIACQLLPADQPTAVLSGPSFATEVALGLPTALTLAGNDSGGLAVIRRGLASSVTRLYVSDDPIGVSVAGAMKNVLAIACGITIGLGFGTNGRAALIARGIAEISRIIAALGGQPATAYGLAGLGDVVLSCTSEQSRNFRYGLAIGKGAKPDVLLRGVGYLVEGACCAHAAHMRLADCDVPTPILNHIVAILSDEVEPRQAAQDLLAREPGSEISPE